MGGFISFVFLLEDGSGNFPSRGPCVLLFFFVTLPASVQINTGKKN